MVYDLILSDSKNLNDALKSLVTKYHYGGIHNQNQVKTHNTLMIFKRRCPGQIVRAVHRALPKLKAGTVSLGQPCLKRHNKAKQETNDNQSDIQYEQ